MGAFTRFILFTGIVGGFNIGNLISFFPIEEAHLHLIDLLRLGGTLLPQVKKGKGKSITAFFIIKSNRIQICIIVVLFADGGWKYLSTGAYAGDEGEAAEGLLGKAWM